MYGIFEGGNTKLLCNLQQNNTKRYKKDTRKESLRKWRSQWEETMKGAITKELFPSVERRLAVNLNLSPKGTTITLVNKILAHERFIVFLT